MNAKIQGHRTMAIQATRRRKSAILIAAAWGLQSSHAAAADSQYTYDTLGRLSTVTQSSGVKTCYEYDVAGNRTKVDVTSGSIVAPEESANLWPFPGDPSQWYREGLPGRMLVETSCGLSAMRFTLGPGTNHETIGFLGAGVVGSGTTVHYTMSLKATPTLNAAFMGVLSSTLTNGWGTVADRTEILSGPGTLAPGGPAAITGLSTTEWTRVRVTRVMTETASIMPATYLRFWNGAPEGGALILRDPSLTTVPNLWTNANNGLLWSREATSAEAAGTIDGGNATKFTLLAPVGGGFYWPGAAVDANKEISYLISLKATSTSSTAISGIIGAGGQWGANSDGTAVILSGPGSVQQEMGSLWRVTGLSASVATRILIKKTTHTAGAQMPITYLSYYDGIPAGAAIIAANPVFRLTGE